MNIRITTLTTLSLVAASFALAQSANAVEPGNSRFNFAPQTFRQESNPTPASGKYYNGPVSAVHSGGVPKSANFLGVPAMAPAAPAPMAAPVQIAAAPVMTAVTPKIIPSAPPAAFNSLFGQPKKPVEQVAQAPRALPPMVQASTPMSKPVVAHAPSANSHVSGQLLNHKHAIAHSAGPAMAMPSKPVSSYGSGFGYQSGPTTLATGSGSHTSTDVSGVIVKRH